MGALTIDPTKSHRSLSKHRPISNSGTGNTPTVRLPDSPNFYSTQTPAAHVKVDIWGSIGEFVSKAIPWVLTGLGALLAIALAARTHELHQSNSKKETEPLKQQEIHDALGTNPKDFNLGNPEAIHKFFDTKLRTAWNNISAKEKFELIDKYPTISGKPIDQDSLKFHSDYIGTEKSGGGFLGLTKIINELTGDSAKALVAYNNATSALRLYLDNNHFLSFAKEVLETSAKNSFKSH
jgi:hypothetical protein